MLLRFLKVAWGSSNIGNSGICWIFKACCQNNLSKYHMHLLFSTWWISNKNMVCIETWTRRQRVCDLVRICLQDHIWRTCSSKEQAAWKMNEEDFKRHTEAISKNSHQQSLCLPNTDKLKSHITTHLTTKSPCMCSSSSSIVHHNCKSPMIQGAWAVPVLGQFDCCLLLCVVWMSNSVPVHCTACHDSRSLRSPIMVSAGPPTWHIAPCKTQAYQPTLQLLMVM